jgi:hypothetical protein
MEIEYLSERKRLLGNRIPTLKIFNVGERQMSRVWPSLDAAGTQNRAESPATSFAASCRFAIIPAELAGKPA